MPPQDYAKHIMPKIMNGGYFQNILDQYVITNKNARNQRP